MARSQSKSDGSAHAYWIKALNEARNNARQAITNAEAWGISPELSVGPVDVEEMSRAQKIMAQTHSHTLDYYDHLAPWKGRFEELWKEPIWEGLMPTGDFEQIETTVKHTGSETIPEPELDERGLALENVPYWRMRIVSAENGDQPKRYKLYLPAGACHAIYNQLMSVQNRLKIAADVGAAEINEEDIGVVSHEGINYNQYES